jgi:phosphoribosylformylglycinamidine (FGAM) synthase PurS component
MITKSQAHELYYNAVHPNRQWIDAMFGTNETMLITDFKKNNIINLKISKIMQLKLINNLKRKRKRIQTNIYLSACREVLGNPSVHQIASLNDESDDNVMPDFENKSDNSVNPDVESDLDDSYKDEEVEDEDYDSNDENNWKKWGDGGTTRNKRKTKKQKTNKKRRR